MGVGSPPRPADTDKPTGWSELEALREQALIEEARRRARARRRGYALVVLLGLAVAVAIAGRPGGERPALLRSGGPGRVAFAGTASVNGRIAIADRSPTLLTVFADGSGLQATVRCPLDVSGCRIVEPAWSPDGGELAFVRGSGGPLTAEPPSLSLYLVDASGGAEKLLAGCGTCGEQNGAHLSWSPDGSQIVFSRDRDRGDAYASTLWIDVAYRVRSTNDRRNLVFPFYVIGRHEEADEALPGPDGRPGVGTGPASDPSSLTSSPWSSPALARRSS